MRLSNLHMLAIWKLSIGLKDAFHRLSSPECPYLINLFPWDDWCTPVQFCNRQDVFLYYELKIINFLFFSFTKSFQGGQFNIKVQKHFLGSKWYHLNSYWKKKDEANAYNEVNLHVQFFYSSNLQ